MAVDYPERVGDLSLVSTSPGWPFAYPVPAVSTALIARTGSLTREVAARSHAEKALSARTVLDRPEVADRLVARPADPGALAAQAAAGTVAFVVDDLATVDPWAPRGIEIRGAAVALTDQEPPLPPPSRKIIRISSIKLVSWGLDGPRASRAV